MTNGHRDRTAALLATPNGSSARTYLLNTARARADEECALIYVGSDGEHKWMTYSLRARWWVRIRATRWMLIMAPWAKDTCMASGTVDVVPFRWVAHAILKVRTAKMGIRSSLQGIPQHARFIIVRAP